MSWITKGFILCGLYDIVGTLFVTKLFTADVIFKIYPELFSKEAFVFFIFWGLAYLSVMENYSKVPYILLVFAGEKLGYAISWYYFHFHMDGISITKQV
jgi:hypothetical protein